MGDVNMLKAKLGAGMMGAPLPDLAGVDALKAKFAGGGAALGGGGGLADQQPLPMPPPNMQPGLGNAGLTAGVAPPPGMVGHDPTAAPAPDLGPFDPSGGSAVHPALAAPHPAAMAQPQPQSFQPHPGAMGGPQGMLGPKARLGQAVMQQRKMSLGGFGQPRKPMGALARGPAY